MKGRGEGRSEWSEWKEAMCEEFVMLPCRLSSCMSGKCQRWRPAGDNFKVDHDRLPIGKENKYIFTHIYLM